MKADYALAAAVVRRLLNTDQVRDCDRAKLEAFVLEANEMTEALVITLKRDIITNKIDKLREELVTPDLPF